nr:hypothetical protein [Rhizobium leguminosarum]
MRIRLLGGLEVMSREHRQIRFTTRKTSLLFATLVLAGRRGHRRELLSEAFWPGRSNEQARNSLRQALVDIRRSFPAGGDATVYIDGDQETVALITGPVLMKSTFRSSTVNWRPARRPISPSPPISTVARCWQARPFRTNWTSGSARIGAHINARRCNWWSG